MLPQDLLDYLYTLIAPTHLDDCNVLYIPDCASYPWESEEDGSCHGLLVQTPAQGGIQPWEDHLWRVLKPGGHLLLISPEDQPIGHTGCSVMEDRGFEVRDAIFLAEEVGDIHYIPKPNNKERHAGLGAAGNTHPTVKPKAVMARLLKNVPKDAVVLDPFMGSGTTGLACQETGHSFIGVEKDPDYFCHCRGTNSTG